jgi:hypothetical protein
VTTCQWKVPLSSRHSGECGQKAIFCASRQDAPRPQKFVCRHHLAKAVEALAGVGTFYTVQVVVLDKEGNPGR